MSPLALVFMASTLQQGNMGGAARGNQGRRGGGAEERNVRPEDADPELWTERTAIVTPGDRVEYRFVLKKGETVFAAAESDAFDVALAFVDAKGKELLRNDDREEGDQSPFLTFRAPAEGTYVLSVLGFRSAAGGRFTLKFRTLTPLDAPHGVATLPRPATPDGEKPAGRRAVFRLVAKKGEIVDFGVRGLFGNGGDYALPSLRTIGPTGVERADLAAIATPDRSYVFQAKQDGDFYVEVEAGTAKSLRTDFRTVVALPMGTTEELALDLAPGELKIVRFPVAPDEIVRTSVTPGRFVYAIEAMEGEFNGVARAGDGAYGNTPAWTWFRPDRNSADDNVRVFHGKGTVSIAVRSTSDGPQKLVLRNTGSLPEWTPDRPFTGDLPIAGSRFFLLKAGKADLTTAQARGERFEIDLDFFRLDGSIDFTMLDRATHAPKRELFFPEGATYLVRVACDGFGGAGAYTIRRDTPPVSPYRLGTTESLSLGADGLRFYRVDLEGGKLYQLVAAGGASVQMLADDGGFVGSQIVRFGGQEVHYLTAPRSGRYRLWVRGQGELRFRLEPGVLPGPLSAP